VKFRLRAYVVPRASSPAPPNTEGFVDVVGIAAANRYVLGLTKQDSNPQSGVAALWKPLTAVLAQKSELDLAMVHFVRRSCFRYAGVDWLVGRKNRALEPTSRFFVLNAHVVGLMECSKLMIPPGRMAGKCIAAVK
jgi:hypothetical protein